MSGQQERWQQLSSNLALLRLLPPMLSLFTNLAASTKDMAAVHCAEYNPLGAAPVLLPPMLIGTPCWRCFTNLDSQF
jgi:hypothetical protein